MRLGTIIGGKNWSDMNRALKEKSRAAEKLRREAEAKESRRRELEEMGFKPIDARRKP